MPIVFTLKFHEIENKHFKLFILIYGDHCHSMLPYIRLVCRFLTAGVFFIAPEEIAHHALCRHYKSIILNEYPAWLIVHIIEGRKIHSFHESAKVLVDIFRSTSTMPVIIRQGALGIIPVASISEARKLKKSNPDYVLVGERYGFKIPGFDLNNSPSDIRVADLKGKTVVFTSTNGTHVLKKISGTGPIFIGSFLNANATLSRVKEFGHVDVVLSGRPDGSADEDVYFGQYFMDLLLGKNPDFGQYAQMVRNSQGAKRLKLMGFKADIEASLDRDSCDFALEFRNGEIVRS